MVRRSGAAQTSSSSSCLNLLQWFSCFGGICPGKRAARAKEAVDVRGIKLSVRATESDPDVRFGLQNTRAEALALLRDNLIGPSALPEGVPSPNSDKWVWDRLASRHVTTSPKQTLLVRTAIPKLGLVLTQDPEIGGKQQVLALVIEQPGPGVPRWGFVSKADLSGGQISYGAVVDRKNKFWVVSRRRVPLNDLVKVLNSARLRRIVGVLDNSVAPDDSIFFGVDGDRWWKQLEEGLVLPLESPSIEGAPSRGADSTIVATSRPAQDEDPTVENTSLLDRLLLANLEAEMRVHRCCGLHHSDAEVQLASHLRLLEEPSPKFLAEIFVFVFPGRFEGSWTKHAQSWAKHARTDLKAGWNGSINQPVDGGEQVGSGRTEETECAICLSNLAFDEQSYQGRTFLGNKMLRKCPNDHYFHRICLDRLISGQQNRQNARCPKCRRSLPRLQETCAEERPDVLDAERDRRLLAATSPEFERLSPFFRTGHAVRTGCWDPLVVPIVEGFVGVLSAIRNNLATTSNATRARLSVIRDVDSWRALFRRIDASDASQETRRVLGLARDALERWIAETNRYVGPRAEWFRTEVAAPLRAALGRHIEAGKNCFAETYRGTKDAARRFIWEGQVVPALRDLDTAARTVANRCGPPLRRVSTRGSLRCTEALNKLHNLWTTGIAPKLQQFSQNFQSCAGTIGNTLHQLGALVNAVTSPLRVRVGGATAPLRRRFAEGARRLCALIGRVLRWICFTPRPRTSSDEDLFSQARPGEAALLGRGGYARRRRPIDAGMTICPGDYDDDYEGDGLDMGMTICG